MSDTRTEITVPATLNLPADRPMAQSRYLMTSCLDDLRKAYAKHHRWLSACTDHTLGGTEMPSVRTMPSKAAKHHMYGHAARLVMICGWDTQTVRCHSLDDIAILIMRVESLMRAH